MKINKNLETTIMKTIMTSFIVILFLGSCVNKTKIEFSEEQKQQIISEIDLMWDIAIEGIEQLDAEKAFSVFSKNENAKYIRDGYLYPSIETAKKQYAEWFRDPNALKQKVTFDPLYNEVLSENLVLTTAMGAATRVDPNNPDQKPWIIGYTMIWKKENVGWRIINMHNSWE